MFWFPIVVTGCWEATRVRSLSVVGGAENMDSALFICVAGISAAGRR
jgi:hypothetical protein